MEQKLLHHKIVGTGPPVLVLHGLFGMLDNWYSFAKSLQEEYQFILVDQRNHGRSFHATEMDYGSMAQDVLQLVDVLELEEVMVMGHSMGGKTAMQFALSHPDRVSKLAVLDIAPKVYRGDHNEIFEAMMALDLSKHQSRSSLREDLSERLGHQSTADMLLKNIARTSEGFSWRFGLQEIHDGYELLQAAPQSIVKFEGPTLFVRGGRSRYIKEEDAVKIHKLFSNAQISELTDAGHWVHVDAAAELKEMLHSFFQG